MGLQIAVRPHRSSDLVAQQTASDRSEVELETVDCLLCGGRDFETIVQTPDFATAIDGEFRVVQCAECGLAFTNPRPKLSTVERFYPADYAPHEGHLWDTSWRGRMLRRMEHAVLRSFFDHPPQPARVWTRSMAWLGRAWIGSRRRRAAWIPFRGQGRLLDFGCGAAGFLRQMQQYGWSVEGLDFSAAVAAKVGCESGIQVRVGSLPHPDVRPASFDAITMWSSLEHVHDPRRTVRAAGEALRRGGLLLVYVPNLASWAFRRFGEAWYGLDLPRHLVHFTPDTLSELLESEGFRILRMEHIGRDGWLRQSARRAAQLGRGPKWLQACAGKPVALALSRWTERADRADSILALAEWD